MSAVSVEELVITNRAEARNVTQAQSRLERKARRLKRNPYRRDQYRRFVRRDHSIRRAALATLDEMLEHSDKTLDGAVWPSQERLATATGYHRRTVQRHIDELEKAGYIVVIRSHPRRDPATGLYVSRKTNRYYFRYAAEPGGGKRISRKGLPHLCGTESAGTPLGKETPPAFQAAGVYVLLAFALHARKNGGDGATRRAV